jgi:hypothetical protein
MGLEEKEPKDLEYFYPVCPAQEYLGFLAHLEGRGGLWSHSGYPVLSLCSAW